MNAHKFTRTVEDKTRCVECGKTRGAKVHKEAKVAQTEIDTGMTEDEAEDVAPAKKAQGDTVRIWVGWRITKAALLEKGTLATKLREAKVTSELDRYVRLTADELRKLDAVAVKFAEPGNTGPVVYSARTLRRRIAEALATLEGSK